MMEWKKYPVNVALIGGDGRMYYTAESLAADGCRVMMWGQKDECEKTVLEGILQWAQIVILPIPGTRDGKTLYAPMVKNPPTLAKVCEMLHSGQLVAVGTANEQWASEIKEKGCTLLEYGKSETYAIPNALATAEGAIAMAIRYSKVMLAGSSAAVLGYGRIGKQLSRLLSAMGAKVTVFARRENDLAYAQTVGLVSIPISQAEAALCRYSLVFNTVPVKLLDFSHPNLLGKDSLFFDLAPIYDETKDARIIRCASLPYRYSPKSAGESVYRCVKCYAEREEGRI